MVTVTRIFCNSNTEDSILVLLGATVARGYRCVVCLPVFHNMMASNNRRRRGDSSDSSSGSSSGDDDGGGGADSEATLQTPALKFKNDGSFLEMFKKMQQQGVHNERVMKQPCDSAKESLPPPQAPQPPSAGPSDSSKAPVAPPPCKPQGLLSLVSSVFWRVPFFPPSFGSSHYLTGKVFSFLFPSRSRLGNVEGARSCQQVWSRNRRCQMMLMTT